MAQLERDRFLQKNSIPLYDGTQDYLLWLGCMGAYDPQGREIVLSLIRVLRHSGITAGVLKKEKCTGDAARRLGNDLAFQQLAEFNLQQIAAAGAKKLLSICPHCVRTIREDWRSSARDRNRTSFAGVGAAWRPGCPMRTRNVRSPTMILAT